MRQGIAALLLVVAGAGCLQAPLVDGTAQPIIGGTRTTGDPGVVLLVASFGNGYSMCTAEIVSPHVVMTAAHCVDPAETGPVQRFDLFLGDDLDDPAQASDPGLWIKVKETHHDAKFDGQRLGDGHDVAVAILDQPTSRPPLLLNHSALANTHMGQMVRIVGYGVTNGWSQQGSGKKRVAQTPLTDFDPAFVTFGNSQKGTCQGDSGGPAFMMIGGVEVIVGVTSFGDVGCQDGGWDTRVDTMGAPFVDPYIAKLDPPMPNGGGSGGGGGGTAPHHPGGAVSDVNPSVSGPGGADDPVIDAHDPAACGTGCAIGVRDPGVGGTLVIAALIGLAMVLAARTRRVRATS